MVLAKRALQRIPRAVFFPSLLRLPHPSLPPGVPVSVLHFWEAMDKRQGRCCNFQSTCRRGGRPNGCLQCQKRGWWNFFGVPPRSFSPLCSLGKGGSACAAQDLFLKLWKLACFARGWSAGILAEIQQGSGKEPVPLLVVFPGLSSSPCTPVAAGGGFSSSPLGFFSFSFCRSAGRRAAVACSSPSAG